MADNFGPELADAMLAESEAFTRTYEAPDHEAWIQALDAWIAALRRLHEVQHCTAQRKAPADRKSEPPAIVHELSFEASGRRRVRGDRPFAPGGALLASHLVATERWPFPTALQILRPPTRKR